MKDAYQVRLHIIYSRCSLKVGFYTASNSRKPVAQVLKHLLKNLLKGITANLNVLYMLYFQNLEQSAQGPVQTLYRGIELVNYPDFIIGFLKLFYKRNGQFQVTYRRLQVVGGHGYKIIQNLVYPVEFHILCFCIKQKLAQLLLSLFLIGDIGNQRIKPYYLFSFQVGNSIYLRLRA